MPDQNSSPNTQDANATTGGGGDTTRVIFTPEQQAVVDRIAAERGKRGEHTATHALLEALGVKSVDELHAVVAEAAKLRDTHTNALQQAQDALAEQMKQGEQLKQEKESMLTLANDKLLRANVIVEAARTFDESELGSVWLALKADPALFATLRPKSDSDEFDGVGDALKKIAAAHPLWLKQSAPRPPDINASAGGKGKPPLQSELIDQKKRELLYSASHL